MLSGERHDPLSAAETVAEPFGGTAVIRMAESTRHLQRSRVDLDVADSSALITELVSVQPTFDARQAAGASILRAELGASR
jgi:hypothetical protein